MKGVTWLLCLTGVYATILAVLTILNWYGADRFWLGALNFYLPQALWALPGIVLTLLLFRSAPLWSWLPLLCLVWVFGPIMGFQWSRQPVDPAPEAATLRVMTWNIKYGSHDLAPLTREITRCAPDVVLFQDAVGAMDGPLRAYFEKWQVRSYQQYVIASRHPLSEGEVRRLPGDGQSYLRCQMQLGQSVVTLYNLHFKTPRRSLNAFRTARREPWYLPKAIELFDHNVNTRLEQALSVGSGLDRETGPVIVAGDLNSPDASQACAVLRHAGLHDAFVQRGRGYGFTYGHFLFKHRLPWLKVSWMRIDHIMMDAHFRTERCWAGSGAASDHRPVIADLVLQRP